MNTHQQRSFNGLTPAEAHLLAILVEECTEVIQIVSSIQRSGLRGYNSKKSREMNADALVRKMADVRVAMILVCEAGIAYKSTVHRLAYEKLKHISRYLHHSLIPDRLKAFAAPDGLEKMAANWWKTLTEEERERHMTAAFMLIGD